MDDSSGWSKERNVLVSEIASTDDLDSRGSQSQERGIHEFDEKMTSSDRAGRPGFDEQAEPRLAPR